MTAPDDLRWVVEGLPHAPPMRLLDAVVAVEGRRITCGARIGADHVLLDADGLVSGLVALELFAQAAAALLVFHARASGGARVEGYLLGARKLTLEVEGFRVGDDLTVEVEERFSDGPLAQFEGTLTLRGDVVAAGAIHVVSTR